MASTVSRPDARTLLNTVETRPAKATRIVHADSGQVQSDSSVIQADSETALTGVNPQGILGVIRQTLSDVGLKQEAAASLAGVRPSQFSEALNGRGNFGATWLWAQDDHFWLRFVTLVMDVRGLTPERGCFARSAHHPA